ncbi:acyl-CoA synthetase (AMP-forming)/AMP-acid ligase II [Nocardia sp. GAS34]|uniref:class I adenylate-forming enzyme family protein n=1 Tax=Nocardia sp. GAS34 TaxID=3156305 RepID=UPI003D199765
MNFSALPDLRAATNPHAPALTDDDTDLDNTAFLAAVQRAAATLRAHGVIAGDVVGVMLPNTAAHVVSLFAAWRLGAAVNPIDPALPVEEAGYHMACAGAKVLIAAHAPGCGFPVHAVVSADRLTAAEPDTAAPARADDDTPALLTHTCGAAGNPNGMTLDHLKLNALCRLAIEIFALTDTDHSLSILPLFNVRGIAMGTLSPLLAGGRATIAGPFNPTTFFDRIECSCATYFSAVPTMYTQLSALPADTQPNTSSVRFAVCGAARASLEVRTTFERRYRIPIIHDHGLAEVPAHCL